MRREETQEVKEGRDKVRKGEEEDKRCNGERESEEV